jgi:uncharacterized protein YabN with tetrapyrrole methylase and pyrophosphatase domain
VAESVDISEALEGEIGDLLFAVSNLARFFRKDPEQCLRKTIHKFEERFHYMESRIENFQAVTLEDMERLWQEAKTKT